MRIASSAGMIVLSVAALRGRSLVHSFTAPNSLVLRRTLQRTARTLKAKAGAADNQGGTTKTKQKPPKNAYASTIRLPVTEFSQRANANVREPQLQAFWKEYGLYDKLSTAAQEQEQHGATPENKRFVLHDGPPYANGDLHIGHALNKILKDFINRKMILRGKQVHYVPGWDCHGLPIELKVLQTMSSKERQGLSPVDLRARATQFAQDTVQRQSISFQRYGIIGDFDNPYLTLDPSFEAAQVNVFWKMYSRGYIFRGRKPVHWSPSSQTALAEAELEYPEDHVSTSIYVAFTLLTTRSQTLQELMLHPSPDDKDDAKTNPIRVAIWTTTPWTIPANMAVAVNPILEYSVVQHPKTGKLIVATELVKLLAKKFDLPNGQEFNVLASFLGSELEGSTYVHPLYDKDCISRPIVSDGVDYITTDSGTGLVHTAPGHGQEDYATGLKYGLELRSPVDNVGKFTIEAGPQFVGLQVLNEGNTAVVAALNTSGALIKVEDYNHKYPYDWRTKKPTIVRATDQWFASVQGFRDEALKAIDTVQWIPDIGKNRIQSFVSSRGDWCISRQRSWGVPIPVFYDVATGKDFLLDEHTLTHIQEIFAKHGSDAWWTMDEKDLLPDIYKDQAHAWKKGTDTMDVWFDSGSSWSGVTSARNELAYPADLYLEGSDQHRGWFQSSLLTSVAANNKAPYKTVLTHGFVLDEKGYKMSKSLGNVIDPMHIIEGGNNQKLHPAYGADVLRLWVASVDYAGDVCIGDAIIKQIFESYRKLRNTARYLVGNLADFIPANDGAQPDGTTTTAVPYDELPSLDKWMLGRLSAVMKEVDEATNEYQFNRATQELLRFSIADLSNFYLDVAKDRLYISASGDARRRSCQTVLHACLEGFTKAIAPILPHMAEDIWQNLPYSTETSSVFEGGWPSHLALFPEHDAEQWSLILNLRNDVNKMLELARTDKLVGASLDAAAVVYAPDAATRAILDSVDGDVNLVYPPVQSNGVDDLRTTLMLSQVQLVDSMEEVLAACDERYVATSGTLSGCVVGVKKAVGKKCGRCWFYDEQIGTLGLPHGDVCQRCNEAIFSWEKETGQTLNTTPQVESEQQPVS